MSACFSGSAGHSLPGSESSSGSGPPGCQSGSNGSVESKEANIGSSREVCSLREISLTKSGWDRNRTCKLRFWSLLPFVQRRSGEYTSNLEIAHFVGPMRQDVHQRSPAFASPGVNSDTGGECTRGAARTEFFVW
jgi:hypothetical protein